MLCIPSKVLPYNVIQLLVLVVVVLLQSVKEYTYFTHFSCNCHRLSTAEFKFYISWSTYQLMQSSPLYRAPQVVHSVPNTALHPLLRTETTCIAHCTTPGNNTHTRAMLFQFLMFYIYTHAQVVSYVLLICQLLFQYLVAIDLPTHCRLRWIRFFATCFQTTAPCPPTKLTTCAPCSSKPSIQACTAGGALIWCQVQRKVWRRMFTWMKTRASQVWVTACLKLGPRMTCSRPGYWRYSRIIWR